MTPDELAAIRERTVSGFDPDSAIQATIAAHDRSALLAELDRLIRMQTQLAAGSYLCNSQRHYTDPYGTYTATLHCDAADHHRDLHSAPIGDGYRYTWGTP